MVRKLNLSKERLKRLYLEKEKSTIEIAEILDTTPSTILRYLKRYNIPVRSISEANKGKERSKETIEKIKKNRKGKVTKFDNPNYVHIPKEKLKRLYLEEEESCKEIGGELGVSWNTIRKKLKKYDIPLRNLSESHRGNEGYWKGKNRSKETIRKISESNSGKKSSHWKDVPMEDVKYKYLEENKNAQQIASELDLTHPLVMRRIKYYDLDKKRDEKLEKELRKKHVQEEKTIEEIAGEYGVDRTKVSRWFKKYSISTRYYSPFQGSKHPQYRDLDVNKIKNRYKDGYSAREIAKKLDTTKTTILNRLRGSDIELRDSLYGYKEKLECDDGHKVDSTQEREIDNWLFHRGILHQVHKEIGYGNYKCDFYIPKANVYIEIWGLKGKDFYDERIKKKHDIYDELDLNLVDIYPPDNFRDKLSFLLKYSTSQTTLGDFSEG